MAQTDSQEIRIYEKPTEVLGCSCCPASVYIEDKEPIEIRCGEYPDEIRLVDPFEELPIVFPGFCPLKPTGKKNVHGYEIRQYLKPTAVYCCMNCPSFERMTAEGTPLKYRCSEFKDETKEIAVTMEIFDKFPGFCPLKKSDIKTFLKERGF